MADPIVFNQWEWTKLATGVTSVVLNNKRTGLEYFYTLRVSGDTAPTDLIAEEIPAEAVRIFEVLPVEVFKAQYSFDIYVFCAGIDKLISAQGAIRVDESAGSTEGDGTAYLNVGQPFNLKVNQGLIPGHSTIDKFGENPSIDTTSTPEDIWEGGGEYIYDANNTAPIVSIISDSGVDNMDIMVVGLDINGNEVEQTVSLNGTTRVALPTPLWRVYRMANDGDAGEDLDGTCYCYIGTGGVPAAANIRALIDNGNNQTLMAIYTIPLGKVGYLYRGEIGGSRSQNAGSIQASYYSRRVGKVFRIKKRIDVTNQGSSIYVDKRSFPDIIPALTDIRLRVEEVSANNTGVFGTFDILLIDDDLFPQSYLDAIGQPGVMP